MKDYCVDDKSLIEVYNFVGVSDFVENYLNISLAVLIDFINDSLMHC